MNCYGFVLGARGAGQILVGGEQCDDGDGREHGQRHDQRKPESTDAERPWVSVLKRQEGEGRVDLR